MKVNHLLFSALTALALAACGPTTSHTPVPCATDADCPVGAICESLESEGGPTETICLEETDCGELTCASGRCATEPDLEPAAVKCIAAP